MKPWVAILEGDVRERALQTIEEVVAALGPYGSTEDVSLGSGKPGLALLFAELERVQPGRGHRARAETLLSEAVDAVADRPLPPSLYGGFVGVAWTIERLQALDLTGLEGSDEIDEALLGLLARTPWAGHYDLINGLVGIGAYLVERLPRPLAAEGLARIVDHLENLSTRDARGTSWWTQPAQLGPLEVPVYPAGNFNLGVAHGIPGILALLALSARAGVAEQKARALLADGARWLLANQLPDSPGARFPAAVAPGIPAAPTRSAWCYGDPGVALCLLAAARVGADAGLEQTALEIGREALQRPLAQGGVRDAGLCHGAAGLAHLANRLYQASGAPAFKDAALFWIHHTLDLKQPGQGVGGYRMWTASLAAGPAAWEDAPGVLTGAAGIALSLLAACHPLMPAWDGMLLAAVDWAT